MKIAFAAASPAPSAAQVTARLVGQDALPGDLDPLLAASAKAGRFTGKVGQVCEGVVAENGGTARLALVGIGEANSADRIGNLERAGAALIARYLRSGETAIALDLSGAGLDAADAAAVLLGARLRGWSYDTYRTRLADDQKATLTAIEVTSAPDGTDAAWQRDEQRTQYFSSAGMRVLRFVNRDVMENLEGVLAQIREQFLRE